MQNTLLHIILYALLLVLAPCAKAQNADMSKLSPQLRTLVSSQQLTQAKAAPQYGKAQRSPMVCAFVKTDGTDTQVLTDNGCRVLASLGDISIAEMPLQRIPSLTLDRRICRIEAQRGTRPLLDSVYIQIGARDVYAGTALPQAFTGEGVVVGVQDVGFDLTHPNFLDTTATRLRIKKFWDQLSTDTVGSALPVGAEYEGENALMAYAHSRDAYIISHGTHTLGIAAGSGYHSKYRGIAYDSDICLVSNAVSQDAVLIDTADYYKYTYATDALGFKYIFDYAESVGQPCVINFSEGSAQDFRGDDVLYYEMLRRLTGPGRIIVSAAGNNGREKNYFVKERGCSSAGVFIRKWTGNIGFTLKADADFRMRMVVHGNGSDTLCISSKDVTAMADSVLVDTVVMQGNRYIIAVEAAQSCYNPDELVLDVSIGGHSRIGMYRPLSVEVLGEDARVELYRTAGEIYSSDRDPSLVGGDNTHSILSPASADCVICVGATSYRTHFVNSQGQTYVYNTGTNGERGDYSSVGPTYDGRTKPDVMAPGTNIISSYGSYYIDSLIAPFESMVETFDYKGRTYGWCSDSGTSMASPAVAGVIALWLQAKPDLTTEDVIDIFRATCSHPDPTLSYPNNLYGYGQIDAYRGLLHILGIDGIKGISASQPQGATFSVSHGGRVDINFGAATTAPLSIKIYSTSGMLLRLQSIGGGASNCSIDLSAMPKGVYAVQIDSPDCALHGSTLIRI